MSDQLQQAQRRFLHSNKYVDALHEQTQRWIAENADSGVIEDDSQTSDRILRIRLPERPPILDWGLLIGDALHNMRSGLDQLVWLIGGNPPRNPKTSEFPIYIDPAKFHKKGRAAIRSLPEPARKLITTVQPCCRFQTARERAKDKLWILHELSNEDKHHALHIGAIAAANRPGGIPLAQTFVSPLEDNDVLGRWSSADPDKPKRAKHCRLSLFIAFDPEGPALGRPVVDTLRAVSAYIDESVFSPLKAFL